MEGVTTTAAAEEMAPPCAAAEEAIAWLLMTSPAKVWSYGNWL